jgi:hypothetical protein
VLLQVLKTWILSVRLRQSIIKITPFRAKKNGLLFSLVTSVSFGKTESHGKKKNEILKRVLYILG